MNTKELTTIAIFTALTALGAFISVPLGNIPITLQTFFVLLAGLLLKPKLATLSQLLYMIIGLIGIPIFSGFRGGPQQIFSLSFGFIIGFIFSAYITSIIFHNLKFSKSSLILSTLIGTIVIYAIGIPYMYLIFNMVLGKPMSFIQVLNIGCFIFLPGDILKLILASILAYKLIPLLNKTREVS